jgi:hypothetical protein
MVYVSYAQVTNDGHMLMIVLISCGYEIMPGIKCGVTLGVSKGEGVGQVRSIC